MKSQAIVRLSWLLGAVLWAAGCTCKCPPCPEVACAPCASGENTVPYSTIDWTVERVVDGDTVIVASPRAPEPEKVRLLQINTPERGKRGYAEASSALEELIDGRAVRLEFVQSGVAKRDRFGRLLAYLFVGELNLNVEMVRLGWTKYWTKYGRGRYPGEFERAEAEARSNRRGLWRK